MMKNVKLESLNNSEERECNMNFHIGWKRKVIYAEAEIDGVKYEGELSLKKGFEVNLPYYIADLICIDDHTIVEYDIFLLNNETQRFDYQAVIFADLGQEDPANPKPENIYFIENERELKRYIDDLIDEEKNPWWDREDGQNEK